LLSTTIGQDMYTRARLTTYIQTLSLSYRSSNEGMWIIYLDTKDILKNPKFPFLLEILTIMT